MSLTPQMKQRRRSWRMRAMSAAAYEAETMTLLAAMSPPPNAARAARINKLIATLKAATIWSKFDLLYILASHSAAPSLLNWKAPGTRDLVAVNSPTFTADAGYAGNGTDSRLRTQYTPSTDAVQYTQNSGSAWIWNNTVVADNDGSCGNVTAPCVRMAPRSAADAFVHRVNDNTGDSEPNTTAGFFGTQRSASNLKRQWKNGSQLALDNTVSTGLPAQELWICGANATHFTTDQIGAFCIGASLSGLELALYNALNAYMTGLATDYP